MRANIQWRRRFSSTLRTSMYKGAYCTNCHPKIIYTLKHWEIFIFSTKTSDYLHCISYLSVLSPLAFTYISHRNISLENLMSSSLHNLGILLIVLYILMTFFTKSSSLLKCFLSKCHFCATLRTTYLHIHSDRLFHVYPYYYYYYYISYPPEVWLKFEN